MGSCSDNGYYYECSLRAGTFSIDWMIRKMFKTVPTPDIYLKLEKDAEQIPAGSDGLFYLPYLCGAMNPYWDVNARGAFIGLSPSHSRGHIYRAILEGIGFEQLFAISSVEKAIGTKVKELVVIGGGAKSKLWCSILADVTGKTIGIPENAEASGLGAAIAAAVGAGWFRTFKEAAKEMTGSCLTLKPDPKNHKTYSQSFGLYRKLYPALKRAGFYC